MTLRVVTSPVEALEYDVPRYVRSEVAALKIVLFYILCMSPLIIAKAIQAVPVSAAFAGFSLLVLLATFAWTMYLYVLVVMVTYDYGCGPATVLVLTTGLFMLYIRSLILGAL